MSVLRPTLLFFVTADWFFCSHFLERAKASQEAGYEVIVVTHVDRHRAAIEDAGFRLINLEIDRRSLNPLAALYTLWQLINLYRRERPDIIHQVALKPILLGSLAARFSSVKSIVNAVVGGGYTFTSDSRMMRVIRPLLVLALRFLLNPQGSKVIFENEDDLLSFVRKGLVHEEDAVLIEGAGINVDLYCAKSLEPSPRPVIVLPARLLWDKGIGEFVQAARMLRAQGVQARFVLIGGPDLGNRANIDNATLERWKEDGIVELWGFRNDMPKVLYEADIVCLPSYREGLPKALLEGMAAALPCVTTDVPGCRAAVHDGVNGLLVPPRDPEALAGALLRLINEPCLRRQMGLRGRERVLAEFASRIICRQTLSVYDNLLLSCQS